jgi:DNA (cytosine-5)-methyltransferase 1
MNEIKTLDLFSGIGGFSYSLERLCPEGAFRTVAFCEQDKFCQAVLRKHWPEVPIFDDVRDLTGEQIGSVDIICAGFPCQDISIANTTSRKGLEGEKSGLWSEAFRIIREIRPRFGILENVPNLLAGGRGEWFGKILSDLAEIGFDAEWHCISASSVGAPMERSRVWIITYPGCAGFQGPVINTQSLQEPTVQTPAQFGNRDISVGIGWPELSSHLRVDDGLSSWIHEIKALGNSVVPQVVEKIGRAIIGADQ